MASRKLQRSKSGSYLVTLPKSWVEDMGLEKSSRIDINRQEDGSLHLVPSRETSKPKNKIELKFEDYPDLRSLENMVKACYMQGGQEIQIATEEGTITDEKEKLRKILLDLIASEVTEDRPSKFVIRVLADPRSFSINDLLNRISNLISSIHKDTTRALEEEDSELASDASYRGVDIERLHRLTMRQLSLSLDERRIAESIGINNPMECLLYAVSFRDLCRMGYHVKRAAGIVGDLNTEPDRELIDLFLKMSKVFSDMRKNATEALAEADQLTAHRVIEDMDEIKEYDQKITNKILKESLESRTSFALNSLSTNWRRAAGHAVGVADIATSLAASHLKKRG